MATTSKGIYYPNDYTKVADVPADMKALAKSVDTVIDDINNDINLANRNLANVIQLAMTNQKNIDTEHETNTQQDKDIANLKTENEELKAENERLNQDLNALPSNTAEGEYITLNDSADSRFNKFTIKGNSVQKITTQSANVWSDNTTRTFDNSHRVQSVNLKPNIKAGTYKFSCDISNLVLGTNTGLHLASEIVYEDDSTDGSFYLIPFNAIREDTRYSNSITIEKNIKSISLKVGATQTTNGGSMTVSNFCLRADDSDEYVEFVPDSPSPEFPSDIQNITRDVDIIVANENLFLNGFSTPRTNTDFWQSISSNFTPLEDGWGKFFGTNNGSSTAYLGAYTNIEYWKKIIKLNTEYTIIAEWRNTNLNSGDRFSILNNYSYSIFNGSLIINSSDGTSGVKIQKFTTKNSFDGIRFLFRSFMAIASGNTASIELRVALIEGDTIETEVKVENQEFVFPLAEGQRLYEGSYLADDGIHHKRKQFVVDGTETIFNASLITDKDTVSFNLNKPGAVGPYYGESPIRFCNIYGEDYIKDWGYFSDKPGSLGVGSTTNQLRFVIDNSFIGLVDNSDQEANQEKVANWLKDNNIVVEEEVNEYVEAYTDEQKQVYDELVKTAKSYKTVTNIFSTNEISPKFEVNYRRDIDTYIDNKLANVNEQILNIAGGT